MEFRKYFSQRDSAIWPHRDLCSAFLGNHMYKSVGRVAHKLEPQVEESFNYCESKGRPQLLRLNSSGESTSEDDGMPESTPLSMLPGFTPAAQSKMNADKERSRHNMGKIGARKFMPMQNMHHKKTNMQNQWGRPNRWYPQTDSSRPNPGPSWFAWPVSRPMQVGIQQPFTAATTVPYTYYYGFPQANPNVPFVPVFPSVIPNLYNNYYGHQVAAMPFDQGKRTFSGPMHFPGAKVREFCPVAARQKKHGQRRQQTKKAPNYTETCFKSDLNKTTDMLTNMTITTPVDLHTNKGTDGKEPNHSAVINTVKNIEASNGRAKSACQDATSKFVKSATVITAPNGVIKDCLTADESDNKTILIQCEKQDNAIKSADTSHNDAIKPKDIAPASCTDQHIFNAWAKTCHFDGNAMCPSKQNDACTSKCGASKVADVNAKLLSDFGNHTGKETTISGSIELSSSNKDPINGQACVDSKKSFNCRIKEGTNGFCFHIGMRDSENDATQKTATLQTPQQGSCKKKKKSRPSAKKRRRQKNQRTENMESVYHVQMTNCDNFQSVPKKLKVSHVTDKEMPPIRERHDSDNFDTVAFILNFEQDGEDLDETDNSDILGHAKFSFVIGASSSESDFSDTEFDDDLEESLNQETQELLKCFQHSDDPYNPLSFSFVCRKSPAISIPGQTAIPKSASEPVLSPTDKLKMVNDVWQKNVCDQSLGKQSKKKSPKKVSFAKDEDLATVHPMCAWAHAYAAARRGPWEEYARDRDRFEKRIKDVEKSIGYCFDAAHRERVYKEHIRD